MSINNKELNADNPIGHQCLSEDRLLRVSINENFIDKIKICPNPNSWTEFKSCELTINEIEAHVSQGHAFSYQFKNEYRNTENFLGTDIIVIDIDGSRSLEEISEDELVLNYCSLVYTTPRHTPEQHRFRLVFALPRTIVSADELKWATRALALRFVGDMSATDAAHMFYGSKDCFSEVIGGSISEDFLLELLEDGKNEAVRDQTSDNAKPVAMRSSRLLQPDLPLQLADGTRVLLKDITIKTSIYCPHHHDRSPSAFVGFSDRGSTYIHCSRCNQTWWVDKVGGYDFDTFETEIISLYRDGVADQDRCDSPNERHGLPVEIPENNVHLLNEKYIDIPSLEKGLTLVKSPKGTGKTKTLEGLLVVETQNYRDADHHAEFSSVIGEKFFNDRRGLLIGHRQSLIGHLCERLSLNSYLDDGKFSSGDVMERKRRYGICLDSLLKVADEPYDVIIIDEVEQVLNHFLSETMGEKREAIFRTFAKLLGSADKIVALDADLGWTTFNTLTSILSIKNGVQNPNETPSEGGLPIHIYINEYRGDDKSLNIFANEGQLIQRLRECILDGKRIYVSSNSKKKIKELEEIVNKLAMEAGKRIPSITVTSENSRTAEVQNFIQNISQEILNYSVVLSSPSLGTGIDINLGNERQEIDCVFGFYENRINSHFDIDQQLSRVRHPKEINVWVSPATYNFETEHGVIGEKILKSRMQTALDVGITGDQKPAQTLDAAFIEMSAHITSTNRASKNNLKSNFIQYKRKQGFTVEFVGTIRSEAAEGRQLQRDARNQISAGEIESIMSARTMPERDYDEFIECLQIGNHPANELPWDEYKRTSLELFYQAPISPELIRKDNNRQYRDQIQLFESISQKPDINGTNVSYMLREGARAHEEQKLRFIRNETAAIFTITALLSSTPLFTNWQFNPDVIISSDDLGEFVGISKQLSSVVETQLGITMRNDVDKKPIQQLNKVLNLVGLKVVKLPKPIRDGGKKTYQYQLCRASFDDIMDITKRRSLAHLRQWKLITSLYEKSWNDAEEDYLKNQFGRPLSGQLPLF